jgi:ATP adenylyltransferase
MRRRVTHGRALNDDRHTKSQAQIAALFGWPVGFDFPGKLLFVSRLFFPMQQLHPFWRMDYIEAPRYPATDRPFTDLPALGDDRAALIVYRSAFSYLILNRFPYNPGHLLAVPFRDVAELEELDPTERADLMEIIVFGKKLLQAALKPDGFNVGFNLGATAGGSIRHLHGHLVPRWMGDNNFMPVIGQTRVLPQALEATWERLTAAIPSLAKAG